MLGGNIDFHALFDQKHGFSGTLSVSAPSHGEVLGGKYTNIDILSENHIESHRELFV